MYIYIYIGVLHVGAPLRYSTLDIHRKTKPFPPRDIGHSDNVENRTSTDNRYSFDIQLILNNIFTEFKIHSINFS